MSVAVSSAMAGAAAANAAAASAAAHVAKVERCKGVIDRYESHASTRAEMREYADCVNTVYPAPASGAEVMGMKVAFVLALIGMAIGIWRARKYGWADWGDYILFALSGFFLLPCGVAFVIGVGYGIYWLFA